MNKEKKERLEAKGWKVGTVEEFLGDNKMNAIKGTATPFKESVDKFIKNAPTNVLRKQLRSDMRKHIKDGFTMGVDVCKYLIGEFQRSPKKELAFEEEVKILKSIEKREEEMLDKIGMKDEPSEFIAILRSYLPQQVSEEEIQQWLLHNVDFGSLKNPMQAVGMVMKEFGARADGKVVKEIVTKMVKVMCGE